MNGTGPSSLTSWGRETADEVVRGVSFRTYRERPRDVTGLLGFATRWGARPHLVQGEETVTFDELHAAVVRQAAELDLAGVVTGDRVLVLGFNSTDWIVNFWACLLAGAVPVLGNAWWSTEEFEQLLPTLDLRLVLVQPRLDARVPALLPRGRWQFAREGAEGAVDLRPREVTTDDEDRPAVIIFTSGTSGRSKAVVLSHRSVLAGLHMLLDITRRLPQTVDETSGGVALHTGPMFHIGGVQTLIRAVTVGDTLVMPRGRFDAGEALELVERWRVERWSAVPTMVSRVLEHPQVGERDLSSLSSLTVGGAPVHAEFVAKLQSGLPGITPRVPTGYGLTENGGQATAASGRDTTERPGTCGRPLPCVQVRIDATDGGTSGEVLVKSPTQMLGYLGEDESPVDADGWLHTGDLGEIDADGYLFITGRSKDLVIRGGENIAPAAVEQAISTVTGVVESAVFGIPHPDLGEELMAVVTVQDGVSVEQIEAGVRTRVASFAVPTRWRLSRVPLPTNHSGKIDKNRLRADEMAASGATS